MLIGKFYALRRTEHFSSQNSSNQFVDYADSFFNRVVSCSNLFCVSWPCTIFSHQRVDIKWYPFWRSHMYIRKNYGSRIAHWGTHDITGDHLDEGLFRRTRWRLPVRPSTLTLYHVFHNYTVCVVCAYSDFLEVGVYNIDTYEESSKHDDQSLEQSRRLFRHKHICSRLFITQNTRQNFITLLCTRFYEELYYLCCERDWSVIILRCAWSFLVVSCIPRSLPKTIDVQSSSCSLGFGKCQF